MATAKLIGANDASAIGGEGTNTIFYYKWQAEASGYVTEIKVKGCTPGGHVKVGIYTHDVPTGLPTTRLGYNNTSTATTSAWVTITLNTPVAVVKDTYYWLGVSTSEGTSLGYSSATGAVLYLKAWGFADVPETAPSGMSGPYGDLGLVAGWGILVLSPSSIVQPVSYGTPTVDVGAGGLTIQPSSIVQVVAIGTPALRYPQILLPSSIAQAIAYGTPSVGIVGVAGFIYPQSIVQPVAIGMPTILKYVWHVILDGQYVTETPEKNRMFVIGRDAYGNPVWGEAQDSTEIGLVGERLDFTQELAIPTTAQAGDVASAVLSKMRLMGKRGVILIPPNCGQEIFDIVQISDAGANQAAVSFRVVGIRFEYSPKQARYEHKLILGAP